MGMTAIDEAMQALERVVGAEVGVSNWITVDQPMIDAFAEITHDEQWIHVDPVRARIETPPAWPTANHPAVRHGETINSVATSISPKQTDQAIEQLHRFETPTAATEATSRLHQATLA